MSPSDHPQVIVVVDEAAELAKPTTVEVRIVEDYNRGIEIHDAWQTDRDTYHVPAPVWARYEAAEAEYWDARNALLEASGFGVSDLTAADVQRHDLLLVDGTWLKVRRVLVAGEGVMVKMEIRLVDHEPVLLAPEAPVKVKR